jgi:hypothetical protein
MDVTEARKGSSYAKHRILLIRLEAGNGFKKNPPPGTSNFGINRQTVRGRDFRLVQAPALKAHATTNFELMGYPAIRNRKDSTSRFQS